MEPSSLRVLHSWGHGHCAALGDYSADPGLSFHTVPGAGVMVPRRPRPLLGVDVYLFQDPRIDGHRLPSAAKEAGDLLALVPPRDCPALLLACLRGGHRPRPLVCMHQLLRALDHVLLLLLLHFWRVVPRAGAPPGAVHHVRAACSDGNGRLHYYPCCSEEACRRVVLR